MIAATKEMQCTAYDTRHAEWIFQGLLSAENDKNHDTNDLPKLHAFVYFFDTTLKKG